MADLAKELNDILNLEEPLPFLSLFFRYLPKSIPETLLGELFSSLHMLPVRERITFLKRFSNNVRSVDLEYLVSQLIDPVEECRGVAIDILMKKLLLPLFASWNTPANNIVADDLLFGSLAKRFESFAYELTGFVRQVAINTENKEILISSLIHFREMEHYFLPAIKCYLGRDGIDLYQKQKLRIEKLHYPRQMILALTFDCNLNCSYCYAKDHSEPVMEDSTFLNIIEWMQQNSCHRISFTGGEPTCHPHFSEYLELAKTKGFEIYFSSNGIFSQDICKKIAAIKPLNVGIHLTNQKSYKPGQLDIIATNFQYLYEKSVPLFLRINFDSINHEFLDFVFSFTQKYTVKYINFAIAFPAESKKNSFVKSGDIHRYKDYILEFLQQCANQNIVARLAKPIPFCLFSLEELENIILQHEINHQCTVFKNSFTNDIIVNPDSSIAPCIGVDRPGKSLLSFASHKDLRHYQKSRMQSLMKIPFSNQCEKCLFWLEKKCRGTCLAYHMANQNDTKSGTNSSSL